MEELELVINEKDDLNTCFDLHHKNLMLRLQIHATTLIQPYTQMKHQNWGHLLLEINQERYKGKVILQVTIKCVFILSIIIIDAFCFQHNPTCSIYRYLTISHDHFQVPGFPHWFKVIYDDNESYYTVKLGEEYRAGDIIINEQLYN